jgi:fructose/tagatose bisphosphate aldolase
MMDADEAYFKEHNEPLFSSHMIDLSEESVEYNIETTAKYLKRAAPMKQFLEMEIGITGGEEDGVNNEDVDNASMYTQPEDILEIYNKLSPISPYFSIAAGFGNVHGVYKRKSASPDDSNILLTRTSSRKRQAPAPAAPEAPGLRQGEDRQQGGEASEQHQLRRVLLEYLLIMPLA